MQVLPRRFMLADCRRMEPTESDGGWQTHCHHSVGRSVSQRQPVGHVQRAEVRGSAQCMAFAADAVSDLSPVTLFRSVVLIKVQSYPSSSSIMAPFFANESCDPFLAPSFQCVIGTYVQFASTYLSRLVKPGACMPPLTGTPTPSQRVECCRRSSRAEVRH